MIMRGSENMVRQWMYFGGRGDKICLRIRLKYERNGRIKNDSRTFDLSNWEELSCHLLILGRLQDKEVWEGKIGSLVVDMLDLKWRCRTGNWL